MRILASLRSVISALFHRSRAEDEMDTELRAHIQDRANDLERSGVPRAEAERRARLEFGGYQKFKEEIREAQGTHFLETLIQDLRFGLRMLRKSPGFTAVAILTLALGIGANTAMFGLLDALFLQSIPAKDPANLVRTKDEYSYPEYRYLQEYALTLQHVVANYSTAPFYVMLNGESQDIQGAVVSSGYFHILGLQPWVGRFFTPEEDSVQNRDPVAVIGYNLWQTAYGGTSAIIGKTLDINDTRFTVIGVMPPDFRGVIVGDTDEIWIPTAMLQVGYRWCDAFQPGCATLKLMARLAPGCSTQQAEAEVSTLLRRLRSTTPGFDVRERPVITRDAEIAFGHDYLVLLFRLVTAAAGILLLVICANLAGILVARGAARQREIAMRLALGAQRKRVVRQLLTEGLLVTGLGALLAVPIAGSITSALINFDRIDNEGYPHVFQVHPDLNILLCLIGVTALAGMLFAIFPALQSSRANLNYALKGCAPGSLRTGGSRMALVSIQIALSLALIVAAGLLARSTVNINAGHNMDVHHVLGLRLRPLLVEYSPADAQAFEREVLRRVRDIPGIESASLAHGVGLVWGPGEDARLALPGHVYPKPADELAIHEKSVANGYFRTLRIPFISGRDFGELDRPNSPRVAIVNETLARNLESEKMLPIGRAIIVDGTPHRIIGVVKDAQSRTIIDPPIPVAYTYYWQNPAEVDARMCIRVVGDPTAFLPAIRKTIAAVNPDVPVTEILPLTYQVRHQFVEARIAAVLLESGAGLALLLCAMGLYGVIAYEVRQRTREVGIRMALGANRRDVAAPFLRRGIILVSAGAAAGIPVALSTSWLLRAYLVGVSPFNLATFVAGACILLGAALLACYVPARRAMRVDPMVALRYQ